MKRLSILLGLVIVAGLVSLSFGGNPDTITLKVTPISNVSVNIIDTEYNYGAVALNNTTIVSTAIQVKNDGDVQTSWKHNAGNATGGTSTWTLVFAGVPASTDEFRLWAEVADTVPVSFPETDTVNDTASPLTGGSNVAAGTTRNLWIQLEMPLTVTGADGDIEHSCIYTITAQAD